MFYSKTIMGMSCALSLLLCSCSTDDTYVDSEKESNSSVEFYNITYNGKTYEHVPTTYDENGDFVFLDQEFAQVFAVDFPAKEVSIYIESDEDLTFYKTLEDNLEALDVTIPVDGTSNNVVQTRAGGYEYLAYVELFDDKNYKDTKREYSLDYNNQHIHEERMKNQGFNDKCSSLRLTSNLSKNPDNTMILGDKEEPTSKIDVVFIGYENTGCKGSTIVCVASPGTYIGYPTLPGFNDKMSAYDFFLAQADQYHDSIDNKVIL